MKSLLRCLSLLMLLFTLCGAVHAAEGTKSLPDKPAKDVDRTTHIAVEHEGTDSLGSRLSTRLKEQFNASSLFTLNEKDVPKLRLLVSTAPEFTTRPGVGSAYAVVWVFSQSESTLRHYLAREVGVFTAEELEGLVARLVERTDGIAVKYGYLFP